MFYLDSLKYMHRSDKYHINILQNKFKKAWQNKKKQINVKDMVQSGSYHNKNDKTDFFFFLVAQFGPVQKLKCHFSAMKFSSAAVSL